jgi:hypothetical protein
MIDYIAFYCDMRQQALKSDVDWDISFDEFKEGLHEMIMEGLIDVDWATVH